MKSFTRFLKGSLLILLLLSLFSSTSCALIESTDLSKDDEQIELPSVKDYEDLIDILEKTGGPTGYLNGMFRNEAMDSAQESKAGNNEYSGTNLQVQGVDEADVVKTDGTYIYQVNDNRIVISKVFPADSMEVVNTITIDEDAFYPYEIYIDEKYLTVIGNGYYYMDIPAPAAEEDAESNEEMASDPEMKSEARMISYYRGRETFRVLIYNIEDPREAKLERDFEVEGYYLTSRKIENMLYIIGNRYMYYLPENKDEAAVLPWYRDSLESDDFVAVGYDNIRYFPEAQDSGYLLIASLDLDKINEKIDITAYLGGAQNIYSSMENLYITATKWNYEGTVRDDSVRSVETATSEDVSKEDLNSGEVKETGANNILPVETNHAITQVYRFTLKNGEAKLVAKGEVPGTLLNQFSMDEENGFLRIATTTGEVWFGSTSPSKNNLYVLNSDLETIGRLEDLAPGERIYSVRFIGNRGYMVTFRTVDPLFVIDLNDPENPFVLGELKIPGYSTYLHPYDEDHIIGFGMETEGLEILDENGKVIGETVIQLGIKIALFDVSDVNNPKEKFKVNIGDRGTYSELLYNHKALLFSKDKNLMAFPLTEMKGDNRMTKFDFQGLYVFRIDEKQGFELKAKITHLSEEERKSASEYWFDHNKAVERGLYINDVLYTISKAHIKANSLDTYEELGTLDLK